MIAEASSEEVMQFPCCSLEASLEPRSRQATRRPKQAHAGDPRSETRRDGGARVVPATPAPLFLGQPPSDRSPAEPFQTADPQELGEMIKRSLLKPRNNMGLIRYAARSRTRPKASKCWNPHFHLSTRLCPSWLR